MAKDCRRATYFEEQKRLMPNKFQTCSAWLKKPRFNRNRDNRPPKAEPINFYSQLLNATCL